MNTPLPAAGTPVLTVRCIDPTRDPAWLGLLGLPAASLFHSPAWLRAVAEAYDLTIRALVAFDAAGAPVGGVPFCEVDDLVGRRVVVFPFSDVCDPLVSSTVVTRLLLARLQAHGVPVQLRCLDGDWAGIDPTLTVAKRARWHRLSLEPGSDRIWTGMASATRRAIRKAESAGVEVRPLIGAEGLRGFLDLHAALRKRKYRMLAQPASFFEAIARHFAEEQGWHPLGAFLDGRLIAATIYLRWGGVLYYKFNASALDALAVRPNNVLIWAGAALARSLGCRALDLGPSDDDQPGLIRFKRGFGAAERELMFFRWSPPGFPAERGAEVRRLLGALTDLLTAPDVPDEVASRAGCLLYRYFA